MTDKTEGGTPRVLEDMFEYPHCSCDECDGTRYLPAVDAYALQRENADLRDQLAAERGRVVETAEALRECRLELHYCSEQLKSSGWREGHTVTEALKNSASVLRALADPQQPTQEEK